MGSLSSRPKAPATPQIIYMPAPTQTNSTTADNAAVNTASTDVPETIEEARTDDLLRRPRGRAGTVQTSFRGLVTAMDNGQKKTLLGE